MEVDIPEDQLRQISGGARDKVDTAISAIEPLLLRACKPIANVFTEMQSVFYA